VTVAPLAASDPRNWLLSQPQLIFVLFAGAVWLFKLIARASAAARNAARGPQEAAQPVSGGPGTAGAADAEDEERTRRVREDILRRIAERRAAAGAAQAAGARAEPPRPRPPPAAKAPQPAASAPAQAPIAAFELPVAPPAGPLAAAVAAPPAGALWLEELRSRDAARRAILVREILGPPLALR
jgi:hypothetical protein